eukprot:m.110108 g.110108  ORF g.110108 m.110108 type:complete len:56 (-) comp28011_c0_seq1:1446-1613(-)
MSKRLNRFAETRRRFEECSSKYIMQIKLIGFGTLANMCGNTLWVSRNDRKCVNMS